VSPVSGSVSRVVFRIALAASALLALSACTGSLEQRTDQPQNAADVIRSADLQPRSLQATRQPDANQPQAKSFSFFGAAAGPVADAARTETAPAEDKDGFALNFENSPVANVVKVVLGDIMGVGYVIDPRVQGTISLSSGRPIAKKDMLFVLAGFLNSPPARRQSAPTHLPCIRPRCC
jgi:general secretion pathway protein D